MSKTIWFINDYAGTPEYGMTFRHYYLAKEFVKKGYNSTVITASYSHFLRKFPDMNRKSFQIENIDGIEYIWTKVIKYNNSFDKKRVVKWLEFTVKLFFISKYIKNKPDIIICSPSAPFSILPAYYLAKKFNAKLIFEVRDIWPLTLIELGGFSKKHPFILLMGWFERFALKKSDFVVSNLQNHSEHIKEIGINRKSHWVSSGIDLNEMQQTVKLDTAILKQIPTEKFIVGYTGKLGVSNAISYLIESARLLQDYDDIFFVIIGSGQELENLRDQSKYLKNIIFINPIEKNKIQSMLSLFDVCYIGLKKEKLFKYGVSPNKLFDYMYSGKPIVFSINTSNDLVKLTNCGISLEAENVSQIADSIIKLYKMEKSEREVLGKNGKEYVLNNFIYEKLADKYLEIMGI